MDLYSERNPEQEDASFVGIRFCQECNNMLYPKENKEDKILLYACRNCDYHERATNSCIYVNRVVHDINEMTQIIADVVADPTLPRTQDHLCPRLDQFHYSSDLYLCLESFPTSTLKSPCTCGHNEAVFFQSQSSKADVNSFAVCDIMYNPPVFTSLASQNISTEITKSIRQCLTGVEVPTYEGRKVKERTPTNLAHVRRENDWKIAWSKREKQKGEGYFSQITQPYRELGEIELDTKDLVVDAMEDIGVVFNMENDHYTADRRSKQLKRVDKDKLKKTNPLAKKARRSPLYTTPERIESADNGYSIIRERVAKTNKKVTFVKAGKSLLQYLDVDAQKQKSEVTEEWRVLTPEHLLKDKKSDTSAIDAQKAKEHERTRRRFLAKLECLKTVFCCVLNMKNRDLKSKNPLSRQALRSIRKDFSADSRNARLPTSPAMLNQHRPTRSSFNDNDSDCVPPGGIFKMPPAVASSIDMQSVSRCRLNRDSSTTHLSGMHHSGRNRLVARSPVLPAAGGMRVEAWVASQSSMKLNGSFAAESANSTPRNPQIDYNSLSLLPRRAAVVKARETVELPIWQRITQNEIKREDIKAGRKVKEGKKKHVKDVENMLQAKRDAFENMKRKALNKLHRDLDNKHNRFRHKLKFMQDSIFDKQRYNKAGEKLGDNKVQIEVDEHAADWHKALSAKQKSLKLGGEEEVAAKLKDLLQFCRIELSTIPLLRSRLCLLVMSLPAYDLCRAAMQEAIKFFLTSIMDISEHNLEDWMMHRRLAVHTLLWDH
eukprot:Seg1464.1 transcript_id=Seg1464.1/GoldUCD/mRNA.D3Y31 product="DNA-directed RNA polymerase II subunit RPB9" protein_id=Seg1464.1/GoldUCD/D3Y31